MPKAYIIHDSGYHIEDISPVPQGTDIIVKKLFCQVDKRVFLHGTGVHNGLDQFIKPIEHTYPKQ